MSQEGSGLAAVSQPPLSHRAWARPPVIPALYHRLAWSWAAGAEFLEQYGSHLDAVTSVNPGVRYAVRVPTAHPIHEVRGGHLPCCWGATPHPPPTTTPSTPSTPPPPPTHTHTTSHPRGSHLHPGPTPQRQSATHDCSRPPRRREQAHRPSCQPTGAPPILLVNPPPPHLTLRLAPGPAELQGELLPGAADGAASLGAQQRRRRRGDSRGRLARPRPQQHRKWGSHQACCLPAAWLAGCMRVQRWGMPAAPLWGRGWLRAAAAASQQLPSGSPPSLTCPPPPGQQPPHAPSKPTRRPAGSGSMTGGSDFEASPRGDAAVGRDSPFALAAGGGASPGPSPDSDAAAGRDSPSRLAAGGGASPGRAADPVSMPGGASPPEASPGVPPAASAGPTGPAAASAAPGPFHLAAASLPPTPSAAPPSSGGGAAAAADGAAAGPKGQGGHHARSGRALAKAAFVSPLAPAVLGTAEVLGELMFQSHSSYNACALGSDGGC
jgi:hypothetical protein